MLHVESTTTLRRDLQATAMEYAAETAQGMFIADRVCPACTVEQQAAEYPVWLRENFLDIADGSRTEDGAYNRISSRLGSLNYATEEYGFEQSLDDRKRARWASLLDWEQQATRSEVHRLLLARERRAAAVVNDSSTFTAVSADTIWSTHASAVPLTDIGTGLTALELRTGLPRSLISVIMPQGDFINCVSCTQVRDLLKYTFNSNDGIQPHLVTPAQLATILGVKEVLVGMGGYNTANEGLTASISAIWTAGHVTLAYLASPGDPIDAMSAFRTMRWRDDTPEDIVVETYRDNKVRADVVRVREEADEVATAEADLMNYLIDTTP